MSTRKWGITAFLLCTPGLLSQTAIDLRTQVKNVDFSSAISTRPIKTGTVLPALCAPGEVFFKTDVSAGQNLYGCTATNIWSTLSSSGGGAVSAVFGRTGGVTGQEGDYALTQLSDVSAKKGNTSTVQMSGGGAVNADDCAKFDTNGNLVSAGVGCGTGSASIKAGTGMVVTSSMGQITVAADPAVIPMVLIASVTTDFAAVAPQTCGEQTFVLPGAAVADSVAAGWPGSLVAGLSGMMRVSAPGIISIRLCNVTAAAVDPPAGEFRATLLRSL